MRGGLESLGTSTGAPHRSGADYMKAATARRGVGGGLLHCGTRRLWTVRFRTRNNQGSTRQTYASWRLPVVLRGGTGFRLTVDRASVDGGYPVLRIRLRSVTVSDDREHVLPEEGIVLLVGPNNAGKSRTLQDIYEIARDADERLVLKSAEFVREGTDDDLLHWLEQNAQMHPRRIGQTIFDIPQWSQASSQDILNIYHNAKVLNVLVGIFVLHIDGKSRISAGDSQQSLDYSTQVPTLPIQRAYIRPDIEEALSSLSMDAFSLGVTVDRYSGSVISIRVGPPVEFEHEGGAPTQAFLDQLKALPRLEDQGDGVRSYLGLALHMLAGAHPIMLVDEPEAFLHPPQARHLGRILAERTSDHQVIAATHSSDIVRGALDSDSPTTIIRVTREGNVNHFAILEKEDVAQLWSDPLLRYSNVLDGLFHDAVVVCEGDADCRYYAAVIDGLRDEEAEGRAPQFLFTQSGGKSRLATVAAALVAVSVPVVVVADFDVLKSARDVERIVVNLGGRYTDYERDIKIVTSALNADVKPLRKLTLREEITSRIDALDGEIVDERSAEALRAVIRAESGWDKAKRSGIEALPQGDAYTAATRLLESLASIGLLVVPVGELERFAPGVGKHGPAWVADVLEKRLHLEPIPAAAAFARAIRRAAGRVGSEAPRGKPDEPAGDGAVQEQAGPSL